LPYVATAIKASFVIFDTGTLTLSPERQSARMSKITNDRLAQNVYPCMCTGCV